MKQDEVTSADLTMHTAAVARSFASGRYVVRRTLGEGGQKTVYVVHDGVLDRECALSILRSALLAPDDLVRLQREAQAMARLGAHSHIVTVFDFGSEDGAPYLVCEYVPGGDLRAELSAAGGRLPLDRALRVAADVAEGLASAHAQGIVHRDLKPANIWLGEDGSAKLGDFGLALSLDGPRMTMPGTIMGTAAYLSPEQARGELVNERSDLYALGCLLYEMVCGRPPFKDENAVTVIAQHLNALPVAPSEHDAQLPAEIEELVLALLAKSPVMRPASASAVAHSLRRFLDRPAAPAPAPERSGAITILFTDLVNSGELKQRAGEERAQRIFKAHHRLLREAAEAHGGHEVKQFGDGFIVAFDSARDAIECTIAMQQASRRPTAGERLQIRAGLNSGEALVDDSDYFGTSVVIARRLCDSGGAGQIRASDIVVRLLDGRGDVIRSKDLGALALKGITAPVPAVEIVYEHDPMALLRRLPFVAREAEYETLIRKLAEARNGRGSIVMLGGEPGIGKTRLTEEFCDQASSSATVVRGNCYEGDVSPPFGPWVEALRSLVERLAPEFLRDALGTTAPEIAVLVPELRQRLPDIDEPSKLHPEADRARLFDAVETVLKNASQRKPLVVFLDDLHWCDRPSLALLEQVARNISSQPIVIVGTYRNTEVDRVHPLAQTLAALHRMDHHERLLIQGFQLEGIDALLASIEPSEESRPVRQVLSAVLARQTEGNPLYVREVITSLIESGKIVYEEGRWTSHVPSVEELGIPEGVKEAVGRRLSRLSDGCNQMLARASVFTSGFTWEEMVAISDETEDALLDYLDESLGAQLLAERDQGRYVFIHAMIRQTLHDELSTPRRARLHRRVAESLERLYADSLDSHAGELAAHYMASVGGDTEKAVEYSIRAGRRAMEMVAWEEAAQHFERAVESMSEGGEDAQRHCRVLLDLGEVLIYVGQASDAVGAYRRAAAVARDASLPELLGEAASGLEEAGYFVLGDPDLPRQRLEIIDEALSLIDTRDSAIRARLLAQRTRPALAIGGTRDALRTGGFGSLSGERNEEVVVNARDAVAMAERLGDPAVTAQALNYLIQALQGPATDTERRALAETQIQQATLSGNVRLLAAGYDLLFIPALAQGDMVAAREAHERGRRLGEETKIGWAVWSGLARRATLLLADGLLGESEAAAFEALSVGQAINNATATQAFGGQLFAVRWCQGRLGEIAGMFKAIAEQSPNVDIYQAAVALIYAETGQLDDAQRVIDGLVARGLEAIPEDPFWKMTILGLADASARLRAQHACAALYDVARRHPAGNVSAGNSVSQGAFARSLGQLAMVLERFDQAQHHFEDALDLNETMGHHPALAFTRLNYGDMLLRRHGSGDRERANHLLQQAHDFAKDSGMAVVERDSERLLASLA